MTATVVRGVAERTRIGQPGLDGTSLLTAYLLLVLVIPSRFVVGPLGGAGSPALLFACGCLIFWAISRIRGLASPSVAVQPVRITAALLTCAVLASYVAACWRPGNDNEVSLATLALIGLAGWVGVLFLAHDEVNELDRFKTLLRRLTLGGTLLACFGLFQFLTDRVWVDEVAIPGLSVNNVIYGVQVREGFTRPSGTAVHPIEFGVVLSMLLPLAVAYAATPRPASATANFAPRITYWFPAMSIAIAVALSSSRSAFVCAASGLVVVIIRLSAEVRTLAMIGGAFLGAAIFVLVPGMIGTVLGLFTGISGDSSAQSRIGSYSIAADYIAPSPIVGRGLGTFLPRYRIFDNQYLLSAVEIGILGAVALLVLFVSGILAGNSAGRSAGQSELGLMSQGLAGSVAAGATSFALFDAFSFPMVPGLLFLLLGLAGAARRLASASPSPT